MVDNGTVRGCELASQPIIINYDNVYIHTNIKKVEEEDTNGEVPEDLYEYQELVYSKDEYIQLLHNQQKDLELALAELATLV
jgi:hypothetical protein